MINENEVIEKLNVWLNNNGYTVNSYLKTTERGIDIAATKGNHKYLIEAKGAISANKNSARSQIGFSPNQVKTHISVAIRQCMEQLNKNEENTIIAMALPDDKNHRKVINNIAKPLNELKIKIFWVNENGKVSSE